MEVVVLADTHLQGGFADITNQVRQAVDRADIVIHAGDITSRQALKELESHGETYAVLGNNDHDLVGVLPDTLLLELDGVAVAVIHDSGTAKGRARRLHRRFPQADVVVFGHSHIPVNEPGEAEQILFNPGSPTQRRSQPHRTFGVLELSGGRIVRRHIEIVT
jgi:putative phosphoesterase